MHIVATNDILFFPLVLAIWKLGGISSYGDPALDSETIKYQVCAKCIIVTRLFYTTFIEVLCSVKYGKISPFPPRFCKQIQSLLLAVA